jgi:hypothetical protein
MIRRIAWDLLEISVLVAFVSFCWLMADWGARL